MNLMYGKRCIVWISLEKKMNFSVEETWNFYESDVWKKMYKRTNISPPRRNVNRLISRINISPTTKSSTDFQITQTETASAFFFVSPSLSKIFKLQFVI